MAIGEYMDAEQLARYAGSIDNGAIDTEYTHLHLPHSRVAPPLGDVVAAQGREIAALRSDSLELRGRIALLERLLHRAINHGCIDDYGNEVQP